MKDYCCKSEKTSSNLSLNPTCWHLGNGNFQLLFLVCREIKWCDLWDSPLRWIQMTKMSLELAWQPLHSDKTFTPHFSRGKRIFFLLFSLISLGSIWSGINQQQESSLCDSCDENENHFKHLRKWVQTVTDEKNTTVWLVAFCVSSFKNVLLVTPGGCQSKPKLLSSFCSEHLGSFRKLKCSKCNFM